MIVGLSSRVSGLVPSESSREANKSICKGVWPFFIGKLVYVFGFTGIQLVGILHFKSVCMRWTLMVVGAEIFYWSNREFQAMKGWTGFLFGG